MAPLLTPLPPAAAAVRVGAGHIKTSRTVASTIMLRRVEEVKGDREWARSQVGTKSFTMKSTQTVLEASERLKAVAAIAIIATRFRAKLQARIARHAAAAAEGAAV